jgi:hypothetical protein
MSGAGHPEGRGLPTGAASSSLYVPPEAVEKASRLGQIIDDYVLSRGRATANYDGIAPNPIGSIARMAADVAGEKFVEWFGRQTGWTIESAAATAPASALRWAYEPSGCPTIWPMELPRSRAPGMRGRGPPPMKLFA